MSPPANATQPAPLRSLLAKLVIGASVVVALADSPVPTWEAEEQWSKRVALDEQTERKFVVTIELAGKLYADTRDSQVRITAAADRAASDLTLTLRPLTPPEEPEEPDGTRFPEDTFADAGPNQAVPDAGAAPDTSGAVSSRPSPGAADRAGIYVELVCTDRDLRVPGELRPETCVEQFELTLARESQRTLSTELSVHVLLIGASERRPPGSLQIRAEELVP